MTIATPSNNYIVGIHKQTNEATVGTVADYSFPVFAADIGPQKDAKRLELTDAASIEGDIYYGPSSWRGSLEVVAHATALGHQLQGMWPTDTKTGVGPYVHTFSGLGGTQSWRSVYTDWFTTYKQTFGKGLTTGLSFRADQEGGPIHVIETLIGQEVTKQAHTVTTPTTLADGYFMLQATGCKIELDLDTPDVNPSTQPEKIRNFQLDVARSISAEPVADSAVVSVLGQGKVQNALSMQWLYSSFDAYEASYFGAVGGTSLSSTVVKGALELTAKHSTVAGAAWLFTIYIPAVVFYVTPPTPNPDGSALALDIVGYIQKPASGDHVQPVLTNAVSTTY